MNGHSPSTAVSDSTSEGLFFRKLNENVVMYGCESWTIKKAERQKIDALNCGVGEDS